MFKGPYLPLLFCTRDQPACRSKQSDVFFHSIDFRGASNIYRPLILVPPMSACAELSNLGVQCQEAQYCHA